MTNRKFTDDYKRQIIQEYDACRILMEKKAITEREGLVCSHITRFRRDLMNKAPRLLRLHTLEEKMKIIAEFNTTEPGERFKIAQREEICTATLYSWSKQLRQED